MTVAAPVAAGNDTLPLAGLCAAGLALLALAALAKPIVANFGDGVFIPALAASGLVTAAATWCGARSRPNIALGIVLVFALAMRLAVVGIEPLMSTDIYRYIWDGRVQAAGINPYIHVPADPALAALRDAAIYPNINRADYAVTAYLPFAEMFYLAVTRISESVLAMRLALVACEVVIVAALIALLRRLGRSEALVVAYAWHPLALYEVANNGHVEVLMVALIMCGVWLLARTQRVAGAAAVALAVLVKPYAVFLLPAFWKPWDWRAPLVVLGVVVLCYLPYLGAGSGVVGFLGQGYLSEEGLTSGAGIWLVSLLHALGMTWPLLPALYAIMAAAIMLALGFWVSYRREPTLAQSLMDVVMLLSAGTFLLSPNYAWYLLALVPFLALGAPVSVWAFTLGAFALYHPFLFPANDVTWKTIATLPFLIALAIEAFPRTKAAR